MSIAKFFLVGFSAFPIIFSTSPAMSSDPGSISTGAVQKKVISTIGESDPACAAGFTYIPVSNFDGPPALEGDVVDDCKQLTELKNVKNVYGCYQDRELFPKRGCSEKINQIFEGTAGFNPYVPGLVSELAQSLDFACCVVFKFPPSNTSRIEN